MVYISNDLVIIRKLIFLSRIRESNRLQLAIFSVFIIIINRSLIKLERRKEKILRPRSHFFRFFVSLSQFMHFISMPFHFGLGFFLCCIVFQTLGDNFFTSLQIFFQRIFFFFFYFKFQIHIFDCLLNITII